MSSVTLESKTMRNPGRVAWGVMLISFAIFCVLCIFSTISTYAFFFQSAIPMTVSAQPSRGTLGVIGSDLNRQLVDTPRSISNGNTVSPADPLSQGVLNFRDQYRDNMLIVMVTMFGDSSVATLRQSARPRFEWGNVSYQVSLVGVRGTLDVVIADVGRDVAVDLVTAQGTRVKLRNSGRYTIESNDAGTRVHNHRGEAVMIPEQSEVGYAVAEAAASYLGEGMQELVSLPTPLNLIDNGTFDAVLVSDDGESLPLDWACRPGVLNAPSSKFFGALQDGRSIIQFVRGDGATSNGETTCLQGLPRGQVWRDVSNYDYLAIRSTFYIAHQSLSACGVRASECPLMIRIEYQTASGEARELIYGFYAYFDPTRTDPTQCDTCNQPHILVKMQSWYTFQTENIFDVLPAELRPTAVTSVRFYASGHEYDLRVAELSLLAMDQTPNEAAEAGS